MLWRPHPVVSESNAVFSWQPALSPEPSPVPPALDGCCWVAVASLAHPTGVPTRHCIFPSVRGPAHVHVSLGYPFPSRLMLRR